MPRITVNDVALHYEEAGSGEPILFIHEMAGDYRSWEPQLRHFSRNHRCIVYSARGYLPSDVPQGAEHYSQQQAAADAAGLLDALGIERAHVVGLSMGSFATLQVGLSFPQRALSLTIVGCGSGSDPASYPANRQRYQAMGQAILDGGFAEFVESYGSGPFRQPFLKKDARGWQEFRDRLAEHSAEGTAYTLMGVQGGRPPLYSLETEISAIDVPALIISGDLDTPCVEPSIFLARTMKRAGVSIYPRTGHTVNLEEPLRFNLELEAFLDAVRADTW